VFYRCALGCDMDCGKRGEHACSFPSLEGSADFERCPSLVRERKARLNGRRAGRLERSLRTAAMLVLAIGLWWLYEAQQASFGPLSSLAGPVTRVRDGVKPPNAWTLFCTKFTPPPPRVCGRHALGRVWHNGAAGATNAC
jgi:hypothetical protein